MFRHSKPASFLTLGSSWKLCRNMTEVFKYSFNLAFPSSKLTKAEMTHSVSFL